MNSLGKNSHNLLKNWSDKVQLGKYQLKNRVVLSALTRQRCEIGEGIANDVLTKYYTQRSGAGLLITESASWSQRGEAFPGAANILNKEQAEGWKKVVESVHKH
jgi:N-ethylmaleimide reductase